MFSGEISLAVLHVSDRGIIQQAQTSYRRSTADLLAGDAAPTFSAAGVMPRFRPMLTDTPVSIFLGCAFARCVGDDGAVAVAFTSLLV